MLVVHQDGELALLCDALRRQYVVTEAASQFEGLERVTETRYACVVCAPGPVRVREFLDCLAHLAPEDATHVVFVLPTADVQGNIVYSRSVGSAGSGASDEPSDWTRAEWLPEELSGVTQLIDDFQAPAHRR